MRKQSHARGLRTWHFALDGPGLVALTTTRHGGRSTGPYRGLNLGYHVGDDPDNVAANRGLLGDALGFESLTVADQQHGRRVTVVDDALVGAGYRSDADARDRLGETDGLVTDQPGVALAVLVADCGPVVLFDPVRRVLGVAHVGRRGAVLDVVGATVGVMTATFGTDPADVRAGIGPCIGRSSYEIGGPALDEVRQALGDDLLEPSRPGHARFDLVGAIRRRLAGTGVPDDHVEVAGVDTFASTADVFSDRAVRPCGRFMLVAALR
ncbi:MAG TPA: polyphenol oxidase family protein [Acidimicrobiales bacterium]|nr:polyphenol oxidase family protein [Acidimicrobiales bacterium]